MKKTKFNLNFGVKSTAILFAVILLFSFVFTPTNVAYADWQDDYDSYLAGLSTTDAKDWYFGENYLNIDGALTMINNIVSDENFDDTALKNDPIVIAVIDSGIGYGYTTDGSTETAVQPENIYDDGVEYKLHPIFDNVLLKDEGGNYVYKNVAETVQIRNSSKIAISTMDAITDSGNIACDLVDNTSNDHGTHVTGIVAMLIHKLCLEDYIKILPIKANKFVDKSTSGSNTNYFASYNKDDLAEGVKFAYDNGADIVSLSLTAYKTSLGVVPDGYRFADYTDKMLIVAAAGNNKGNKDGYPAAYDDILGVVNYTQDNNGFGVIASSSNYGSWYDIAAPGSSIISSINGDEYGKLTGTSMATPIAAFASALVYFVARGYDDQMTPLMARTIIKKSATSRASINGYSFPKLSFTDVLTYSVDSMFNNNLASEISIYDFTCNDTYVIGKNNTIIFNAQPTSMGVRDLYRIKWYYLLNGVDYYIGQGWSVDFEIPDLIGSYSVKWAVYDWAGNLCYDGGELCSFEVVYQQIADLDIIVDMDSEGEQYYRLDTGYLDPSIKIEKVEWYVNGTLAHTGDKFYFVPPIESDGDENKVSTYKITAKVNGQDVGDFEEQSIEYIDGWTIFVVIVSIIVSIILTIGTDYPILFIVYVSYYLLSLFVVGIVFLSIHLNNKRKKAKESTKEADKEN